MPSRTVEVEVSGSVDPKKEAIEAASEDLEASEETAENVAGGAGRAVRVAAPYDDNL